MKSRFKIFALLIIVAQLTLSNMASPIREGTLSGAALTSEKINIISEDIYVKIDQNFSKAKYVVNYHIQVDSVGTQIPLLFYAQDYADSFNVWLDDKPIKIANINSDIQDKLLQNFAKYFKKEDNGNVEIYWKQNLSEFYNINDLKYFETNLTKGIHTITVSYYAHQWTDVSNWVTQYSFRYSLSPAKYWKSFGKLNITIEQEGKVKNISTNLGQPNEKEVKQINTWTFNQLPNEVFEINYTPEISSLAKILIAIEPFGLSLIVLLLLILVHVYFTLSYRRKHVHKKLSAVVILGSFIVPILTIIFYLNAYGIIDDVIGESAGKHHGYFFIFAFIFFFPTLFILYFCSFWILDKLYKRKLLKAMQATNNINKKE
jgi:hypothetical protein